MPGGFVDGRRGTMLNLSLWPKREDLYNHLVELIEASEGSNEIIALIVLDLDNFREFCELFGYRDIDEFLVKLGKEIKQACPPKSFVAWLGSDEFAVVLENINKEVVRSVAGRICDTLTKSRVYRQQRIHVSASIGVAFVPDDAKDCYEMLKNATIAMNWVKKHGKNGYRCYEPSMSAQISRKLNLINDFDLALADNHFHLQYQPQVSVATKKIIGVEALIRWHHPELGLIPPLDFIPIAEETGHIHQVGEWVLKNACSDFSLWLQEGLLLERIAVNVSIIQLREENFAQRVLEILEEVHLDPAYLELEITESQTLNLQQVKPQIKALRNRGVKFAIDDFGTGFASLNHLRFMGFDTIKIDKGYIHNIVTNNRDRVIVSSILNMANLLQLRIIAEGVETGDQWEYVKQMDISEVQGYYCSPPVDKERIEQLLKEKGSKTSGE